MNYMLCPPCPISCDCGQNKTRHWGLKRGFLLCRVRLPLLYKCAHYNFPFPSGDIFSVPTHIVKHTKRDLRMCVLVRKWIDAVLNGPNTQWAMGIHTHQTTSGPIVDDDSFTSGETVKRASIRSKLNLQKSYAILQASKRFIRISVTG